jgi:hypothetical protein
VQPRRLPGSSFRFRLQAASGLSGNEQAARRKPVQQRAPLIALVVALAMLVGWLRLSAVMTIVLATVLVLIVALIAWRSRRRS